MAELFSSKTFDLPGSQEIALHHPSVQKTASGCQVPLCFARGQGLPRALLTVSPHRASSPFSLAAQRGPFIVLFIELFIVLLGC